MNKLINTEFKKTLAMHCNYVQNGLFTQSIIKFNNKNHKHYKISRYLTSKLFKME